VKNRLERFLGFRIGKNYLAYFSPVQSTILLRDCLPVKQLFDRCKTRGARGNYLSRKEIRIDDRSTELIKKTGY
jgi:hypothetical protein